MCAAIRKAIEIIYSDKVAEARIWPEEVGYLGMSKDMSYDRGYSRWLKKDGEPANEVK